jgi:hypothetical protein
MSTFDAVVPTAQPSLVARFRLPTGPIQFLGFDKDYWRLWIRGSAHGSEICRGASKDLPPMTMRLT